MSSLICEDGSNLHTIFKNSCSLYNCSSFLDEFFNRALSSAGSKQSSWEIGKIKNIKYPPHMPGLMIPGKNLDTSCKKRRFLPFPVGKNIYEEQDLAMLAVPHLSLCCGSHQGWLVMAENDMSMCLLDPYSGTKFDLPSIITLPKPYLVDTLMSKWSIHKAILSTTPSKSTDCYVMVIFGRYELAYCKVGDKSWKFLDGPGYFSDAIYYKGQFYVVDGVGRIYNCDPTAPNPTIKRVIEHGGGDSYTRKWYIVESGSELFAVMRDIYIYRENETDSSDTESDESDRESAEEQGQTDLTETNDNQSNENEESCDGDCRGNNGKVDEASRSDGNNNDNVDCENEESSEGASIHSCHEESSKGNYIDNASCVNEEASKGDGVNSCFGVNEEGNDSDVTDGNNCDATDNETDDNAKRREFLSSRYSESELESAIDNFDYDHIYRPDFYNFIHETTCFELYKLDSSDSEPKWIEVEDLDGASLFLGLNQSFSIPNPSVMGYKENRIYFTDDHVGAHKLAERSGNDNGVFDLGDCSIEPLYFSDSESTKPPAIWLSRAQC